MKNEDDGAMVDHLVANLNRDRHCVVDYHRMNNVVAEERHDALHDVAHGDAMMVAEHHRDAVAVVAVASHMLKVAHDDHRIAVVVAVADDDDTHDDDVVAALHTDEEHS